MPNTPLEMLLAQFYKHATDKQDAQFRQHANEGIFGDHYNEEKLPPHMVFNGPNLPPVSRAPMFRPQTDVRGGPEFANTVEDIFDAAPDMRGRSPNIQHGPTNAAIRSLQRSDIDPSRFANSSLLGVTDLQAGNHHEIGISPGLGGSIDKWMGANSLPSTIAHELGHVAGYGHGDTMDGIQETVNPLNTKTARQLEPLTKILPSVDYEGPTPLPIVAGDDPRKQIMPESLDAVPPSSDPYHLNILDNLRKRLAKGAFGLPGQVRGSGIPQ